MKVSATGTFYSGLANVVVPSLLPYFLYKYPFETLYLITGVRIMLA